MLRRIGWGLTLLLSISLSVPTANAQPISLGSAPRALCVTDPYGAQFFSWYGSPVAFNSYFYFSGYGGSSNGYSSATNGFYLGGVPVVASATTAEWTVQRTSVFPIGSYYPWLTYHGTYSSPWWPRLGTTSSPLDSSSVQRRKAATSSTRAPQIRQVNAIEDIEDDPQESRLAIGDRLMREGRPADAYLQYLKVPWHAGDRGELFFRQALALVAMGRYSHAVVKFKQGTKIDPGFSCRESMLEEIYGETSKARMVDYLKQVEPWTNADPRDPDRLFLLGVVLQFNDDLRADNFLALSRTLSGRGQPHQASP